MERLIVTIDGPAGSGKSTVAKLLAERLGAKFLDTGAMYRTVTLAAMRGGVDMEDQGQLLGVLSENEFEFKSDHGKMTASINDVDVTEQIRQPDVTANSRYIASAEKIRSRLVEMQRQFAAEQCRVVTEGRDQGTVAFDDADAKFYLTAEVEERARRRHAELQAKGQVVSCEEIQAAIETRDASDRQRSVGPLKPARDAEIVDTTDLTIEQVVQKLFDLVSEKCEKDNLE